MGENSLSIEIKFKDRDPLIFEKPVTAREALEKIDFPKRENVIFILVFFLTKMLITI